MKNCLKYFLFLLFSVFIFSSQSSASDAYRLFMQGRYNDSIPYFKAAIEEGTEVTPDLYATLVQAYFYLGNYEEALPYAEEGYEKYPYNQMIQSYYILSLYQLAWQILYTDTDRAGELFESAYNVNPDDYYSIIGWCSYLNLRGGPGDAHSAWDIISQKITDYPEDETFRSTAYYIAYSSYNSYLEEHDWKAAGEMLKVVYSFDDVYKDVRELDLNIAMYFDPFAYYDSIPYGMLDFVFELTEDYPGNYQMLQELVKLDWFHGDTTGVRPYQTANKAWEIYLREENPQPGEPVVVECPLRGTLMIGPGFNGFAFSHCGINRYSVDMIIIDDETWNAPCFSPVDGTVSSIGDNQYGDEYVDSYVFIDIGDNCTVYLIHLIGGSIVVAPGQQIKKGDYIGSVGYIDIPHLHMQIVDNDYLVSIPWVFEEYSTDNGKVILSIPPEGKAFSFGKR